MLPQTFLPPSPPNKLAIMRQHLDPDTVKGYSPKEKRHCSFYIVILSWVLVFYQHPPLTEQTECYSHGIVLVERKNSTTDPESHPESVSGMYER